MTVAQSPGGARAVRGRSGRSAVHSRCMVMRIARSLGRHLVRGQRRERPTGAHRVANLGVQRFAGSRRLGRADVCLLGSSDRHQKPLPVDVFPRTYEAVGISSEGMLILPYKSGITRHEQGCQCPAEPSCYPGPGNPRPAPWGVSVRAPVLRLMHIDDRDNSVDRVARREETWIAGRTFVGRRHKLQSLDIPNGHDQVKLLGDS